MIGPGFDDSLASGLMAVFVCSILVAMVAGWALIEGVIWLFHHLTIGVH